MANTLIGSSNVYRFYNPKAFTSTREYTLLKCTQVEVLKATLTSLNEESKVVLLSVVENFIVDAVGTNTKNPEKAIKECIDDFLKDVDDAALRLPDTRFGVVLPLGRPSLLWYQERIGKITEYFKESFKNPDNKKPNNVTKINCIPSAAQQFDPDKVHLTSPSAKVFLNTILEAAERLLTTVDTEAHSHEEGEVIDVEENKTLEERLEALEKKFEDQSNLNFNNSLMFARIREELDTASNKSKEDRVVINGIRIKSPLPTDTRGRIDKLRAVAKTIFEQIMPGFRGEIVYLTQGKKQAHLIPMIEVKMDKVEHAIEIRKAFADRRKKKDLPDDLNDLFISNSVNLATRIRVDILKAIAKKITNDKELAYVAGFVSRPMMHIRKAGPPTKDRPLKSYNFIEAVSRFGMKLKEEDLGAAYNRAGHTFAGQFRQNFVVLREEQDRSFDRFFTATTAASTSSFRGGARGGTGRGRGYGGRGDGSAASSRSHGKKRPSDESLLESSAKR
jgi:hypothetical protein